MPTTAVFEYPQTLSNPLRIEYFYKGEKIDDPSLFFDLNPGIFEHYFPSEKEILETINQKQLFFQTHKLIISEYGFHMICL